MTVEGDRPSELCRKGLHEPEPKRLRLSKVDFRGESIPVVCDLKHDAPSLPPEPDT